MASRAAGGAERRRPALAVFTPLPPMRTGIADYSAALLPLLAPHYRIRVMIEDAAPAPDPLPGIGICRLSQYRPQPGTLPVYMLGNNPDHLYMLGPMARWPGLVVLHDPGLHNLLDCATASLGDADGYGRALTAEHGAAGSVLGRHWQQYRLREAGLAHTLPLLGQILGPQRHVLVHSAHAAWKVAAVAPQTGLSQAPHLWQPPLAPDLPALRARLGLPQGVLLLVSLGFASAIKQIDQVLRVLARIGHHLPDYRYLIAGQIQPEQADLPRLIAALGLHGRVVCPGYLPESELPAIAALADIVINLRHPVGGETSGTLIRALGAGACTIVTDDGPFAELPDSCVIKLPWGPMLARDLAEALLRLAHDPGLRRAIGAAARAEIAQHNQPEQALSAYQAAISAARATRPRPWWRQATHLTPPAQSVLPAAAPLWWRARAMPLLERKWRILALVPRSDHPFLPLLGGAPQFLQPAGLGRAPPRAAEAAVLVLTRPAPDATDRRLLAALNRALAYGAVCAIEARGLRPDARPLSSRAAGAALLAECGFAATLAAPRADTNPAQPGLCWQAHKISEAGADG